MVIIGFGVNIMNKKYTEKLVSKKFIVAVLSILVTSCLMHLGKITDGVYSTIMVCTVGAYLAANVAQKRELK
jgi:hypothetical protein